MTPLQIRIISGQEDTRLMEHIRKLESFERLSEGEENTLMLCYERLDILTDPNRSSFGAKADPRLGLN